MKQTIKQFVFMAEKYLYADGKATTVWVPQVWYMRVEDSETRVFISEQEFVVDIPDDFDPTGGQVAALEAQKLDALKAYQATIADINERLSKLLALETT